MKFHSVITTSVSLEDRLDNRGDFYRQKSSFKGRHRQFSEKMWNFISDKCSFYVVYFSGLKYPLSPKWVSGLCWLKERKGYNMDWKL